MTKAMADFWGKIWARKAEDPVKMDRLLDNYPRKIRKRLKPPDLALVLSVLSKGNKAAPGPDGLPFAAWKPP